MTTLTSTTKPAVAAESGDGVPAGWRLWLLAIRPFSFTASVIPTLVGSSLAVVDHAFKPALGILMVVASVVCHAGANLANDLFDHQKGIDSPESLGPSGVIQRGLLSPAQVRRGMIVAFGIATLLGLLVVWSAGWSILLLALFSLGVAIFYTGGPLPLGYIALGEISVFLVMGLGMITGAYFVYSGTVTLASVLVAIPIGCLVALLLHANNIRDIGPDRAAGKRTLATILGRHGANFEFLVLILGSYVSIVSMVAVVPMAWPALLTLVTLPMAVQLTRRAWKETDLRALNQVVRDAAQLHFRFGMLLTMGLLLTVLGERVS